jgi:arylsulfatase
MTSQHYQKPNIVLIMVDQWRGDCLSIDGHPVVHTPYLDQLALGGARFSQAYSATPTCIPARASLFTGLGQASHGRVGYLDGIPWNYRVTLAGEFTRHGYQTQAIGKMHVYPERSQMGFQNVLLHDGFINHIRSGHPNYETADDYIAWLRERTGGDADYFAHGLHCNSNIARPWDKEEMLHPTNWVADQSVRFLRRRDPRKPFFLFMSFHRPHPPYDPPGWALDYYLERGEMPPVPVGDWSQIFADTGHFRDPNTAYGEIDPYLLRRARAGYYGHMTHIDHQINRFLWALREHRLYDDTYICFVSDHGELMGDHHLFRKGLPYDGSARVPLILKGPAASGIRANHSFDPVIELRDVMPTLLECAGLPVPEGVEGRSFLPLARGQQPTWRDSIHGEHLIFGQSIQWLTDGREKYVWFSKTGQEQLFDLVRDPQELHDLAGQPDRQERLAGWRQRLVEALDGREEGFVQDGHLVTGRSVYPCLGFLQAEAGVDLTDQSNWHLRGAV